MSNLRDNPPTWIKRIYSYPFRWVVMLGFATLLHFFAKANLADFGSGFSLLKWLVLGGVCFEVLVFVFTGRTYGFQPEPDDGE